ncbi:conserved Plasmodium protein, unknown function [Plasmodium ovale wallikeri]|uniref:RNA-binding protein n=2 Tax=Plasmodium ovale TaxID=36330 RepID=A0A1C3KSX5_PLAOA|nr:conserved Plasmodium protein, unknown function [Plasmodium ovale wallikeri]SBT77198.1 conserved Plasmodium protein, unknown function [Plasmodium ovale]
MERLGNGREEEIKLIEESTFTINEQDEHSINQSRKDINRLKIDSVSTKADSGRCSRRSNTNELVYKNEEKHNLELLLTTYEKNENVDINYMENFQDVYTEDIPFDHQFFEDVISERGQNTLYGIDSHKDDNVCDDINTWRADQSYILSKKYLQKNTSNDNWMGEEIDSKEEDLPLFCNSEREKGAIGSRGTGLSCDATYPALDLSISQDGPFQHGPLQHGPLQHGPLQHGPLQHDPSQGNSSNVKTWFHLLADPKSQDRAEFLDDVLDASYFYDLKRDEVLYFEGEGEKNGSLIPEGEADQKSSPNSTELNTEDNDYLPLDMYMNYISDDKFTQQYIINEKKEQYLNRKLFEEVSLTEKRETPFDVSSTPLYPINGNSQFAYSSDEHKPYAYKSKTKEKKNFLHHNEVEEDIIIKHAELLHSEGKDTDTTQKIMSNKIENGEEYDDFPLFNTERGDTNFYLNPNGDNSALHLLKHRESCHIEESNHHLMSNIYLKQFLERNSDEQGTRNVMRGYPIEPEQAPGSSSPYEVAHKEDYKAAHMPVYIPPCTPPYKAEYEAIPHYGEPFTSNAMGTRGRSKNASAKFTLIVNVPPNTTRKDLMSVFSKFGNVDLTMVVCDKESRHPNKEWTATSGYAFVRFSTNDEAERTLNATMSGIVRIRGSRVRATWAKKDSYSKKEKDIIFKIPSSILIIDIKELICCICKVNLSYQPILLPCCYSSCCSDCLRNYFMKWGYEKNFKCPNCFLFFSQSIIKIDKHAKGVMALLYKIHCHIKVRCPNMCCKWTGFQNQYLGHFFTCTGEAVKGKEAAETPSDADTTTVV